MFTLNFKSQFANAVEAGAKRQTIRAHRKDGRQPHPGDHLRLYTGMRTKSCRLLLDATCTRCVPVQIVDSESGYQIFVGGHMLDAPVSGLLIRWEPR